MQCSSNKRLIIIWLALALITLGVYSPVLKSNFINFDDPAYVIENHQVQSGLTMEGVIWAFSNLGYSSNWHPLTWLSHMLDCQLYGLNPAGHHLTNLLLHVANTLLLFGLLRRLTGTLWRSAFVAALFAWHPLHVESVAWISERKDVLSTFFWMLTMLAYAKYVSATKDQKPKSKVYYGLALLCFALGLMCKPMLVTLPFVLLLMDYWPLQRICDLRPPTSECRGGFTTTDIGISGQVYESKDLKSDPAIKAPSEQSTLPAIRKLIWEKVPFFILALISSVLTVLAQKTAGSILSLDRMTFSQRAATALEAYCRYLFKLFWPRRLSAYYAPTNMWPVWMLIGAALFLAVITLATFRLWRKSPYLAVGWLWFLGTLAPVIGLVQVGMQSMADRYTYIPSIGLFIMVCWDAENIMRNWPRRVLALGLAGGVALAGCLAVTWTQVHYWKNSGALFSHSLQVAPANNFMAHTCLGLYLAEQGRHAEAIEHYRTALSVAPTFHMAYFGMWLSLAAEGKSEEAADYLTKAIQYLPNHPSAHNQLGLILLKRGKPQEAMSHFLTAVKLDPYFADAHLNLADLLSASGNLSEAALHYSEALKIKPHYPEAERGLGFVLARQGKKDEAMPHFIQAIQWRPEDAEAHYYRGLLLVMDGRSAEAVEDYETAVRLKPDWAVALNDLAWIRATHPDPKVRDGHEAVRLAEHARDLTSGKEARFLGTLDAAYAEAGQLQEAETTAQKAHDVALSKGQKDVAVAAEQRLDLYRSGRPYHQP